MKKTPEWRSWYSAKRRCHTPSSQDFPRYGAKGVEVCAEWRHSFETFYRDMGPRPPGTSLDRYPDPHGHYTKENCRWATPRQQANNRRNSLVVMLDGQTMTLKEAARARGASYHLARERMHRGWPLEAALSLPPSQQKLIHR
jgi:hypothetical protein